MEKADKGAHATFDLWGNASALNAAAVRMTMAHTGLNCGAQ